MEICGKREMELLEKIGFTRIAGSPEEEKAAQILKEEVEKIGVPVIVEPFEIEQGIVEKATLEILEPFQMEVPPVPVPVPSPPCTANPSTTR